MRRLAVVAVITAGMLMPAAPALALGEPQRPSGPLVPMTPSDNGGDNGFGNCGHNSSRGKPPLDGGNGGLVDPAKAGACRPDNSGGGGDDGGGIV